MKTLSFPFLLCLLFLASCSTEPEEASEQQQEPELLTYSLSLGGELEIAEGPMKSANNDLFGIQLYEAENGRPYAMVVADAPSQLKFNLKEGRSYNIVATYIKNGKNIVADWGSYWGYPFYASTSENELNKILYGTGVELQSLTGSYIAPIEGEEQRHTEADRYYTRINNFIADASSKEIALDLKRISFGLTLEVDLGQETSIDRIRFQPEESKVYHIDLENGKGSLTIPYLTFSSSASSIIYDGFSEAVYLQLGTDDNISRFFSNTVRLKRNTMYTLTFSKTIDDSNPETTDGSVSLTLEEDMLEDSIDLVEGQTNNTTE